MATVEQRKRAAICTLGCRLNQSEATILGEKLVAAGYDLVPFGEDADLGIVNTCTVTNEADAKSRKMIRSFTRRNPEAYVAVIGCYSQMSASAIGEIGGVDLIIGNQEKLNLLDYVGAGKNDEPLVVRDRIDRDDFTIELGGLGASPFGKRANLKIQDGCDFMCSFCVIPFARGRARSRAFENLLEEAHQLVNAGAKELVLTGVNIGTYAFEGKSVVEVVDALNGISGLERIRISSIEPTTIPQGLLERMADDAHRLVPYLHIPLQSGSDNVLEIMRRRYTRRDFIDFIEMAEARVPDLCIGTDVLVGSPGETDADFEATCDLLLNGPVAYAHVFKYSEREGTAAVRRDDHVPHEVRNARGAIVRRISAEKHRAFRESFLSRRMDVLFEQPDGDAWTGYTRNYIRVAACSHDRLENELRTVTLETLAGDMVMGKLESDRKERATA